MSNIGRCSIVVKSIDMWIWSVSQKQFDQSTVMFLRCQLQWLNWNNDRKCLLLTLMQYLWNQSNVGSDYCSRSNWTRSPIVIYWLNSIHLHFTHWTVLLKRSNEWISNILKYYFLCPTFNLFFLWPSYHTCLVGEILLTILYGSLGSCNIVWNRSNKILFASSQVYVGGRKRQLEIRLCLVVQRVIDWRHRGPLANVAESSESPGEKRGEDAPVDQIFAILW